MHGMMTLYTDKPIILLSFKAGMCTLRVSHARYAPNNSNIPVRQTENSIFRRWYIQSVVLKVIYSSVIMFNINVTITLQ